MGESNNSFFEYFLLKNIHEGIQINDHNENIDNLKNRNVYR